MVNKKLFSLTILLCLAGLILACNESGESSDASRSGSTARTKTPEPPAPVQTTGKTLGYNFDHDAVGKLPTHFHSALTGQGKEGTWVVKADDTASSKPNVLAQTSTDNTDYRFPIAVLDEGSFKDLDVSVKFKAISGKVDQAGGLIFHYLDRDNYYIVRANALESNYRLYHVTNGHRKQFAGSNIRVTPTEWHLLRVECVSNQIKCYYDGELKITATDETLKEGGKVGLWTKADSVIHFDDFTVTAK